MQDLRRVWQNVLLIALMGVTVAACGSGQPRDEEAQKPERGGTALIALVQEPGAMNPFFSDQSGADLAYAFAVEPLFLARQDGTYEPYLAAEIPTVENGGVSEDGRTLTLRLREGVTWSDGKPFTAEDLAFTARVLQDEDSTPLVEAEYGAIESVDVIDPLTARVRLSEPVPGYLGLFRQVLPAHEFDSTAVTAEHPQARLPLGTGPFVFKEWRTGDRMTLERNARYWREPGKPYLDGITIQVTPEKQTAMTAFAGGEYDTVFFVDSGDLPDLTAAAEREGTIDVELQKTPSWVEFLWLNHSDRGTERPHPVLGDPAVREAIDLAIDRRAVIEQVLEGFGRPIGSFIYSGRFAVDLPAPDFEPARAEALLDQAGWRRGPDGVRAKDGVKASLKLQSISGDQVRLRYQQLIQQNLGDVGIDVRIENVPSNLMFGGFADGGLLATGRYDVMMSRDGYATDPASWASLFTSAMIPSKANPDGFTYAHWRNARYDALAEQAATTLDEDARRAAYAEIARIFARERVALPLYSSQWGWAWSTRLGGVTTGWFDGMWTTASSADWFLAR